MKRLLSLFAFTVIATIIAQAAYVENMPVKRVQPNGDTLSCFVSGDEFYHRLHDANGFTIVQNPETGYWVYADAQLNATNHIAGEVNPMTLGLTPHAMPSQVELEKRRRSWDIPEQYRRAEAPKTSDRNHGDFTNLCIFIRFNGDNNISKSLSEINAMYNDSTASSTSVYNYFKTVSYNKIFIKSYYYPQDSSSNPNVVASYEDIYSRGYYMPYSSSNPDGYTNESQRATREFDLLERAVDYVNTYSPVDTSIILDRDNDGEIDNVSFIIKGSYTGWSDLLWPHKWSLYDREVTINGKRVYTFNLLLEGAGNEYFGPSTFCHEMFHTLGAPDLYHYNSYTNIHPVGSWDLMEQNQRPQQQMGAYMKWKYGNWIDSIPVIREPGRYRIYPNSTEPTADRNTCYKIPSKNPNQYYFLEYRNENEPFESTIPGSGLLIYRIDSRYHGNADYNGTSRFDEVWLYRPNSNAPLVNGSVQTAFFTSDHGRTSFSHLDNTKPWFSEGDIDTTIIIFDIGTAGEYIEFTYDDLTGCTIPRNLNTISTTGNSANIEWTGASNQYAVEYRTIDMEEEPWTRIETDSTHYTLTGLENDTRYEWRIQSICDEHHSSAYSTSEHFKTDICNNLITTTIDSSTNDEINVPLNTFYKYSYTQQIYEQEDVGTERALTALSFCYAGSAICNRGNIDIYIGHTDRNQFNNSRDFVPVDSLLHVYHGELCVESGWVKINLDRPFEYNGTQNLVIAIDDNSEVSIARNNNFYTTATPDYRAITMYNSTRNPDPADLDAFSINGYRYKYVSNIAFHGCDASHPIYEVEANVAWLDSLYHDDNEAEVNGAGNYLEGQHITLTAVALDEECEFIRWSNGSTENTLSLLVTEDTSFTAFFRNINVSIEDTQNEIHNAIITTSHNQINIQGVANYEVSVFDITGRMIYHAPAGQRDHVACRTQNNGVFIVRIGNVSTKVMVF